MGFLVAYGFMAGIIVALLGVERLWPASPTQRGEWVNNAAAIALTIVSQASLVALIATSETRLINGLGGGLIDLRGLPWVLGAAIYVLAMDLGEYLFHRAQHAFAWLWAMHSLHHSDRALNVLTTQRHFWLEPAIKAVSIWLVVGVAFKANGAILATYFVVAHYNYLSHSNIRLGFGPLSWLVNSPRYHRIHHSRRPEHHNANFAALFPIFDVLTGSYSRPRVGEQPDTGLDEVASHPVEVLVWPLRGLFRRRTSKAAQPGREASSAPVR